MFCMPFGLDRNLTMLIGFYIFPMGAGALIVGVHLDMVYSTRELDMVARELDLDMVYSAREQVSVILFESI